MTTRDAFAEWVAGQQARFPSAPQPVFIAAVSAVEAYKAALAIAQSVPPPERVTNTFVAEMTRLISDLESEIKADSAEKAALRRQIEVLTREKAELSAEVQSLKEELEEEDDDEEDAAASDPAPAEETKESDVHG